MAEAILRRAAGEFLEVQSAGLRSAGYIHPVAIQAMTEIDIDISNCSSKPFSLFQDRPVETVITLCRSLEQACPTFHGVVNRHHFGFYDPAVADGCEEDQLMVFRQVRNGILLVFEAYAAGRRDELRRAAAKADLG